MRRLLPLVLVALAACQVDVEGAPCRGVGRATEDCPAGQGCGLDHKCSADALDATCPPNEGPEFAADPTGTALDTAPYPTGVASPPACRFGRLGDALAAAAAHAAAHPGTVAVVRAYGDAPFAVAETLSVPVSVRLSGPGGGAARAVLRTESGSATAIELQGEMEEIEVENVSSTGVGVAISCVESGKPSLRDVAVHGAGQLSTGVSVGGACGANLERLDVRQAAGAALLIDAAADAPVEVLGGRFEESGVGIEVHGGRATLQGPADAVPNLFSGFTRETLEITANTGHGIALVGKEAPIALDAARIRVSGNAGTALRIDKLPSGSSVSVTDSELSDNQAAIEGSRYYSVRTAGGVILNQSLPQPLTFTGNTVACNGGEQVGVYVTGAVDLAPDACGASSNFFRTKLGATAVFVGPYATVDASNNYWAPDPPGYVGTGFTLGDACQAATPPPACP